MLDQKRKVGPPEYRLCQPETFNGCCDASQPAQTTHAGRFEPNTLLDRLTVATRNWHHFSSSALPVIPTRAEKLSGVEQSACRPNHSGSSGTNVRDDPNTFLAPTTDGQ